MLRQWQTVYGPKRHKRPLKLVTTAKLNASLLIYNVAPNLAVCGAFIVALEFHDLHFWLGFGGDVGRCGGGGVALTECQAI